MMKMSRCGTPASGGAAAGGAAGGAAAAAAGAGAAGGGAAAGGAAAGGMAPRPSWWVGLRLGGGVAWRTCCARSCHRTYAPATAAAAA